MNYNNSLSALLLVDCWQTVVFLTSLVGTHVPLLPLWKALTILAFATNVCKGFPLGARSHQVDFLKSCTSYVVVHLCFVFFSYRKPEFFFKWRHTAFKQFLKESKGLRTQGGKESVTHRVCATGLVWSEDSRLWPQMANIPVLAPPPLSCISLVELHLLHL